MDKREVLSSGVCHFRVGEDFGLRLMEIAQEHLIYGNQPEKAIKTITESLNGCPTDIAIQILKGGMVLPVDLETQEVICQPRLVGVHDRFPKIDPIDYMERYSKQIINSGQCIKEGLLNLQKNIRLNRGSKTIDVKYDAIFKFLAGNDETLLEELRDDRYFCGIEDLINTTKDFIEKTMKTQGTMDWMMKTFDDFNGEEGQEKYFEYLNYRGETQDVLMDVMKLFKDTMNLDVNNFDIDDSSVSDYIESAIEIENIIKKGIEPVNIMDNYSAGWLSPEGEYYALNGEIANMLHIQIADALQEKGIIPEGNGNYIINPDAWLEEHGWVKIHGNSINYGGTLNSKIGLKDIEMTKKQINIIYEYICLCHNGSMKLGWRLTPISAIRFKDTAIDNFESIDKEYFSFD